MNIYITILLFFFDYRSELKKVMHSIFQFFSELLKKNEKNKIVSILNLFIFLFVCLLSWNFYRVMNKINPLIDANFNLNIIWSKI